MSILSDKEIAQRLDREGPFGLRIVPYSGSVRQEWTISYGLTSYGYDVRLGTKFKVFTNALCGIIDPKAFDTNAFEPVVGDECLIPPNSFALAESLEALDDQLERLYGVHDDDLAGGLHRRGSLASLASAASAAADEVDGLAAAVGAVAGKLARATKEASA